MTFDMYLHDSATMFRFVLSGELTGHRVQDLAQAWTTAQSILKDNELVVDVSGLTGADEFGVDLLSRMRQSGARLTVALPPMSEEVLRSLGLPVPVPSGQCARARVLRFLRIAGVHR
jgi:anti-anti-sigma regulatory factor